LPLSSYLSQRGGGIKPLPGGQEYSDLYDIEAKADRSFYIDDLHTMFQNLLADEFKLVFHKEIKEGPVYALMLDKSGSKMKVNESPQDFEIPINGLPGSVTGTRVPMQHFCWWLGQVLQRDERPVIDKTGLDKNYDFKLSFMPEFPPEVQRENPPSEFLDRPPIYDALR
jgi:uncharacterized protein (TIGR03435 family)